MSPYGLNDSSGLKILLSNSTSYYLTGMIQGKTLQIQNRPRSPFQIYRYGSCSPGQWRRRVIDLILL